MSILEHKTSKLDEHRLARNRLLGVLHSVDKEALVDLYSMHPKTPH
jgi:hypothetical protein